MPPASPVPGWSSGEVCRLIIATRSPTLPPRDLDCVPRSGHLRHNRAGARRIPAGSADVGAGRFRRYKVIDPSFHNWTGLALALRGQAISDFPLCNKSFNLSYCGFDL